MTQFLSSKLKRTLSADGSYEGVAYWCQGCEDTHQVRIGKPDHPVWGWNRDAERPVFTPSVKVTYGANPDADEEFKEWRKERICHTFVGCNGAQPGEVIFLGDCTHALAGTVQPLPDLPDFKGVVTP